MTPPDQEKITLAEKTFETVLAADIHQDNKAGRILAAIAFLTASTVALFSSYYKSQLSPQQVEILKKGLAQNLDPSKIDPLVTQLTEQASQHALIFRGFDITLFAFQAYVFLILVGVILYLQALGPSFNVPSWFKELDSLLFFDAIASLKPDKWTHKWNSKSSITLRQEMLDNYVLESHLIAQKTRLKVRLMSFGSIAFRWAIVAFVTLQLSLFKIDLIANRFALVAGLSIVFLAEVCGILFKANKTKFDWFAFAFWIVLIVLLIFLAIILSV